MNEFANYSTSRRKLTAFAASTVISALVVILLLSGNRGVGAAPRQLPAASGTPSETNTPTPTLTPSVTPTQVFFSCCEEKIRIKSVTANPRRNKLNAADGTIIIRVTFSLELSWRCKLVLNQDCFAAYNVGLAESAWKQKKGNDWEAVPAGKVKESVSADPQLEQDCDGEAHSGTWKFKYRAVVASKKELKNLGLEFDLDVPMGKGKSYHMKLRITEVQQNATSKPTVTIVEVKEK